MRFAAISAAILGLASSVLAQTAGFDVITKPGNFENVTAGTTYEIVWQPGGVTGTVSLSLIGGSSQATLTDKGPIANNIDNTLGKYDWAVPATLGADAIYGIKITLDSDPSTFQYSFPFHIVGGAAGGSTTTVTSVSSTATVTVTVSSASGNFSFPTTAGSGSTGAPGGQGGGSLITSTRTVTQPRATTTTSSSINGGVLPTAGPMALLGGLALAAFAL